MNIKDSFDMGYTWREIRTFNEQLITLDHFMRMLSGAILTDVLLSKSVWLDNGAWCYLRLRMRQTYNRRQDKFTITIEGHSNEI